MSTRLFSLGLALTLALTGALPVAAQERATAGGWATVQAVRPGEKLAVRTNDGEKVEGRFVSASDAQIVLTRKDRQVAVERERIRSVSTKRGTSRAKGALLGAAIGGGGGLAIGTGVYESADGEFIGSIIPAIALIGAGIGAGIGALFGKGQKDVTIYEAP